MRGLRCPPRPPRSLASRPTHLNPMSQANPNSIWKTGSIQTSATGTTFVNLTDYECDEITFINPAQAIDIKSPQQDIGANDFITMAAASGPLTIQVGADAKEVLIRRNDVSATQVYVKYIARRNLNKL